MKNFLILIILSSILFSCKKEKTTSNTNNGILPNPVGVVPASFIKNILVENFTGEWNPNCPTGDDTAKAMLAIDSQRIIFASIHQGDWLANASFFSALSSHLGGVSSYPRATINRQPALYGTQIDSTVISIYNWRQNIYAKLLDTTRCGLAITTIESKDDLTIKVYIGFNDSIIENTHLSLYLIEDNVTAQNQLNAPSPYLHQHVVRKVITANLGDSVRLFAKPLLTKEYATSIAGAYQNKNNLKVVAILHSIGNTYKEHEVLNCQQVKLNATKNWD